MKFTADWNLPWDDITGELPGISVTGGPGENVGTLAEAVDAALTTLNVSITTLDGTVTVLAGSIPNGLDNPISVFTASGDWTPNPDASFFTIWARGGGGAGGGVPALAGTTNYGAGAGGASGSFAVLTVDAGQVASPPYAVIIGAGGGGVSGGTGGSGGTTSIAGIVSVPGGPGGAAFTMTDTAAVLVILGMNVIGTQTQANGAGGTAPGSAPTISVGDSIVSSKGASGGGTFGHPPYIQAGNGGNSLSGAGALGFQGQRAAASAAAGTPADGFGAGGSGAVGRGASAAVAGGAGSGGLVIIQSYILED